MAEKAKAPQIPSTVWWGVRSLLQKSPKATVDERALAASLSVQPAAARQYISELKSVGILNDDGKATELANRWRLDTSYKDAAEEIVRNAYADSLVDLAPPGTVDRQVVINWFEHAGFGHGAARNKAATYFLLGSPTPNDSPGRVANLKKSTESGDGKQSQRTKQVPNRKVSATLRGTAGQHERGASGGIPLNINIQIHIAADAGAEQIESIFSAMRRYLNESSDT